jgi:hypothetical protein
MIVSLKALADCESFLLCITGVNNTNNICIANVIDSNKLALLVSTTVVKLWFITGWYQQHQ